MVGCCNNFECLFVNFKFIVIIGFVGIFDRFVSVFIMVNISIGLVGQCYCVRDKVFIVVGFDDGGDLVFMFFGKGEIMLCI